jgi:hypothetical protein
MAMVIVSACVVLGLLTITVGAGLMAGLIGGIAGAFGDAMSGITSEAPATAPPSGVTLDTPVLDAPINAGFTNQQSIPIQGTVPAGSVGKTGYSVHVYLKGKTGPQQQVANVAVGGTTRFITSPIKLTEGENTFSATLVTPSGEGQTSPSVTYILDTAPPKIAVSSPAAGAKVSTATVSIAGSCDAGATVAIRNEQAPGGALNSQVVGSDGRFNLTVPVVAGSNSIDLTATDQAGNTTSISVTINRDYGQLAAHLTAAPSKFASSSQTTLKLTLYATSFNGGPLANAKVTFTVMIQGLGPIVSPELTTDATGTATWQVAISGATPGIGQASVLVTTTEGDQVTATSTITTT